MSTAAARSRYASPSSPTRGYSQIPNSIIENRAYFTDAEFSLALIILRRGGAGESCTVSDSNWERWTGMSARTKEYAVAGLKAKGFESDGRGDSARFSFHNRAWENFVKTGGGQNKPRTVGRKTGVSPKKGAKVHPSCCENGCALLAAENSANGISLVPAPLNAQPVAQTVLESDSTTGPKKHLKPVSALIPLPNAQPVAQTFKNSLALLQSGFPLVDSVFLGKLVSASRVVRPAVTDVELVQAISLAWEKKRKRQDSEGLFLETVPAALAAIGKAPAAVHRSVPPEDVLATREAQEREYQEARADAERVKDQRRKDSS
jgi:hypothetical protein